MVHKAPSNVYHMLKSDLRSLQYKKESVLEFVKMKEEKNDRFKTELEKYSQDSYQYSRICELIEQNTEEIKEHNAPKKCNDLEQEINLTISKLKIARKKYIKESASFMISPLQEKREHEKNQYLISGSTSLCGEKESREILTSWVINQNMSILGKVFPIVEVMQDYTFLFQCTCGGMSVPYPIEHMTLIKATK